MICYCGSTQFTSFPFEYFNVLESGKLEKATDLLQVEECVNCGVSRQSSFSDLWKDSDSFYKKYPPTSEKYAVKDKESDLLVAKKRLDFYSVGPGSDLLLLDVGSGSGALVHECLDRGVKAYGCEIAEYHNAFIRNIYKRKFEDCLFPTEMFDVVTCHDVLEHVQNPLLFFQELFRVTKESGSLWLEIPDFYSTAGKKHWKKEHLWFFRVDDIFYLAEKAGFAVDKESVFHPIEGKVLFHLKKPVQNKVSILVPPGIGDSYWSIVKLEAMMKEKGIALPDVSVVCPRSKKHNGHQRAFPFLEMFPFIHASWDVVDNQDAAHKAIWREAYSQEGRTLFENVLDNNYFLSYNGHLRVGKELADIDPQWECNWFPKMFVSLEQEHFQAYAEANWGKYIVFYFIFQGTYCYWTQQFSIKNVIDSVKKICAETNCRPIFVGGKWDAEDQPLSQVVRGVSGAIDLVGKTTLAQAFGLIKGAQMVVGYPSGLTIMSAVLKQKTLVIWNDYYNRDFFQNAMPPAVRGKTYFAENTYQLTPDILRKHCGRIAAGQLPIVRPNPSVLTISAPAAVRNTRLNKIVQNSGAKVASTAVICVLKSGGDYDESYVKKLFASIRRNASQVENIEYICLTDFKIKTDQFIVLPLKDSLPGWWSKVEIFRSGITKAEMCVYFDLDTVIVSDISDILTVKTNNTFTALRPWNNRNLSKGDFASGIMRWKSSLYGFFYDEFTDRKMEKFEGDQQYFSNEMKIRRYPWGKLQDDFKGIYSYKRNIRGEHLLGDARIICFHGNPRPHNLVHGWIQENWTE